jgi:hypothetical protein
MEQGGSQHVLVNFVTEELLDPNEKKKKSAKEEKTEVAVTSRSRRNKVPEENRKRHIR